MSANPSNSSSPAAPATSAPSEAAPAPPEAPQVAAVAAKKPAPRVGKLLIDPPDAIVEVDGQKAGVRDGAVEITGDLGSTHEVRLRKGDAESTTKVAVVASGLAPEKLVLDAPKNTSKAAATSERATSAKGNPAPTAAPTPEAKPAAPPDTTTPPDFARRFPSGK